MSTGCASSKRFSPSKKFPAEKLRADYTVMREIFEKHHPSLYWYTSKDSMDACFDKYYAAITDSMNLQQFGFKILAPVTAYLHCGHTSFSFPKPYSKKLREHKEPSFPLLMKIWPDTMVVLSNLNKKDSLFKRGVVIKAINQLTEKQLTDSFFQFMPSDGYSENVNYIRLSAAFPYYYKNIFGSSPSYSVSYLDSAGTEQHTEVSAFNPAADSSAKDSNNVTAARRPAKIKSGKWEAMRNLKIDSSLSVAVMTIHSFGGGTRLPNFYKKSFRTLRRKKISNLVIDLRNNGGGKVNNYTALTRYVKNQPFKVADTVIATSNKLGRHKKYIQNGWVNSFVLRFIARKQGDGRYHFKYWEKHEFTPRKKNFYNGNVYVLINGPTFSASTLFAHAVKGQSNITLIGEEAGGGWHGNNGILIPDMVLPNTKMHIRLPLFRIIQYQHVPKDGRGVIPDIYVPPTVENVKQGIDGKMQKVLEIVKSQSNDTTNTPKAAFR